MDAGRFKTSNQAEKCKIKKRSKAESTHQAMRVWSNCLDNYLIEKGLPQTDEVDTDSLPDAFKDY